MNVAFKKKMEIEEQMSDTAKSGSSGPVVAESGNLHNRSVYLNTTQTPGSSRDAHKLFESPRQDIAVDTEHPTLPQNFDPYNISSKVIDEPQLSALKKKNSKVSQYYERQNNLIESFLQTQKSTEELASESRAAEEKDNKKVKIAIYGSFLANICLFGIQLYSVISSGSLSLIATMADAMMDIVASIILVVTSRAAAKTQWLKYPTGRKRLETVGTIIFSTLMATLSTQLIIESVRTLSSSDHTPPNITTTNLAMILIALSVKLVLYAYCSRLKSSGPVKTFAVDHRNDLFLNAIGLLMGYLSTKVGWYMDPIGGILLALFILFSWSSEAYEHVRLIVGISANPDFLNQLTYTSLTHHEKILFIDTVRAYHVGEYVYVEVDVVMDPETPLWVSHDIGESLQIKLESLSGVARAFVHVDYDFHHLPEHRTKIE